MSETHEIIVALFNSLKVDPEQVLYQEKQDCCPLCLEDFDKSDESCLFVCCGKQMCEGCYLNKTAFNTMLNCPMCRHKTPKDKSESIPLLLKNSNIGKAWAQLQLGQIYDSNNPKLDCTDPLIQKNDNEAVRLYLLSAKQGYIEAQYNLGLMYLQGKGCEKSIKQAIYWFTLAANQGSIEAHFNLGVLILDGEIPSRSRADGMLLLQNAASCGDSSAQFRLAYESKDSDLPIAMFWYKKAALQNHAPSQFNLSVTLFIANQDIPIAMYCLRKAALLKHVKAVKLVKEMETEIRANCASCLSDLNGLGKKCTKCKSVYYCNKECQVNDWKRHKKECIDEIIY